MRVFNFANGQATSRTAELNHKAVDTEWQLESWLHANPEVILDEPLLIFGRQSKLDTGFPDLLALDQWGNVVVVELKKGQSGSGSASEETILSQPQNYAQSLSNYDYGDLDDLYRNYKTNVRDGEWEVDETAVVEDSLKEAHETVFGSRVDEPLFNTNQRMVILAEEITSRTENNARYLLEQGLAVQCVAVQWFRSPNGAARNHSLLVSSNVVDYPFSRVRPEDSKADHSELLAAVRDRTHPQIADVLQLESRGEATVGERVLKFTSHAPGHPKAAKYRFKPRLDNPDRPSNIDLIVWGGSEKEQGQVREIVAQYADELDQFELTEDYEDSTVILRHDVSIDEVNDIKVGDIAATLVDLINHIHPKLANETDTEATNTE